LVNNLRDIRPNGVTVICARSLSALALLALCLPAAGAPRPAEPDRDETVANRARPDYDPLGLRTGAFRWLPSVAVGYQSKDNIFATDGNEVDDDVLVVRPALTVASDWSRHRLAAGVNAESARYNDFDSEDYDDWGLFLDGRLDLVNSRLTGRLSHDDLHEARTSTDDVRGSEVTTYSVDAATLAYRFNPGRMFIEPGADFRRISYDNTASPSGEVDNSDRDRDELTGRLRAGFAVTDSYNLFGEVNGRTIDYDRQVDFDGYRRDSDSWELLAGSEFDLGGKTFGEVFAGYRHWSYDDDRFKTIDGFTFGADVTWNVTGLTTLMAGASRTIESTTIVGAAGIERTDFALAADHELLRNLILSARVAIASEDFQDINRNDDLLEAGFGAKYLLNRYLYAYLGYDFEKRDTSPSGAGREYNVDTIYLRLQGNL